MTQPELISLRNAIVDRHAAVMSLIGSIDPAPEDVSSIDEKADAHAEAFFLRAFTAYEADVERLFMHYVTGGTTVRGTAARTFLRVSDETIARRITKTGYKFLSWAKPSDIRIRAETYMENGWPISDMMNAKAQELSDCERVRNRIAHSSPEAYHEFNIVQRNLLRTERLFVISPGQLLRIRNARLRQLHITYYVGVMNDTLGAILDPPP